ncbi:cation:proton antiporter [Candidatus Micrarchaeota archaeon]|nr:cation:proton antiporter [Candidatus Micrarchaeota archaeon]
MAELITFLIILGAGLFFAEFFKFIHMPYVVTLIIGGMIVGPHWLGILTIDPTMEFIGSIGFVFLMFMAGIEIKLSAMADIQRGVGILSFLNGFVPFVFGVSLFILLGYGWITALLMGIVFISSSVAAIVPSLKSTGLNSTRLGKTILGATLVEDVLSLIVLSMFLQTINPTSTIPLPIFYLVIFIFLLFLHVAIKELRELYMRRIRHKRKDKFEKELRFIFAILLFTVVIFDLIGLHHMIAGFFAGMTLSESIKREEIRRKLHAIGYGIFIPVFFVLLGSKTDISALSRVEETGFLTLAMIVTLFVAKIGSGYIAGKLAGFSRAQSALVGIATTPQLSTTLAVAFIGLEFGILGPEIILSLTILCIVSTLMAPYLIKSFADRVRREA